MELGLCNYYLKMTKRRKQIDVKVNQDFKQSIIINTYPFCYIEYFSFFLNTHPRILFIIHFLMAVQLQWSQIFPKCSPCPTHYIVNPYCPWLLYSCSLTWQFPFFLPLCPSPPLWSLSVFSLFPCFWFYFSPLFCWLGSTYKWNHMVFVFHHLAYFT